MPNSCANTIAARGNYRNTAIPTHGLLGFELPCRIGRSNYRNTARLHFGGGTLAIIFITARGNCRNAAQWLRLLGAQINGHARRQPFPQCV